MLAIKPLSWGTSPAGAKRTRDWWYRSVEEQGDIELAMRFTLSQRAVVAGIPPSYLDLLDRTIGAAKAYRPMDQAAIEQLKSMAANRGSLFVREEQQAALNLPHWIPIHPGSPHECS